MHEELNQHGQVAPVAGKESSTAGKMSDGMA